MRVFLRLAPSPPSLPRRPGAPTCHVGTVRHAPAPHYTRRNSSPAGLRTLLVQAWPPGSAPFCVRFEISTPPPPFPSCPSSTVRNPSIIQAPLSTTLGSISPDSPTVKV
jgi:hypothetical protein